MVNATDEQQATNFTVSIEAAATNSVFKAPAAASVVTRFAARDCGWIYTLPGHKTEQLTRRLQDLLAPAGAP